MNKAINTYKIKGQDLTLKDFDEGTRKVAMYLNTFNVIDSDQDIIRKGAFTKSISERGPQSSSNRRIAFLRHHNWEMPIGKFLELTEDDNGLYAVAQLGNSTDGSNALADYKDGIIREHSIGFRYIQDKIRRIEDDTMPEGGYYDVTEVQLFEGSAVTFGANEYTEVLTVAKSENIIEVAQKIHDEINLLVKALKTGSGTDERLYGIEMKIKFLNARLLDLANPESLNIKHSIENSEDLAETIQQPTFDWNAVINGIR